MTKRHISILLALAVALTACIMLPASSVAEPLPMYVYTENGKPLNVRSTPEKADNIIGQLNYGDMVMVEFINSTGWAVIIYKDREAYVQAHFLLDYRPAPRPTQSPKEKEDAEKLQEQEKLNKELASEKETAVPFYVAVRATRTSGWINFRVGPSKITSRIASFPDGKELIVLGETTNWYRARDPETQKIGYIFKDYTTKLNKTVATGNSAESLGRLTVNGEFDLTCKLPATYSLQVVNKRGSSIVASILSTNITKPQMYLSIAFDETYSGIDRMNDLSAEELAVLENSFTEMNEVEISYRETGYGTKLLVTREVGGDTDFVDILSIYKGYFIEFNMTPSPKAANQTLTEKQIQMCIDFLTNLDFTPVK